MAATYFQRCKQHGLIYFSTPFDETAVDFLETLNVPCYKIASLEITDLRLIQKTASTGKPLIMFGRGYNRRNRGCCECRQKSRLP